MKNRFAGFTLIELLIVVAIIAILAAIAVPNFLEAQTRAKVSRVVSDLRTLHTGVETYRIDHNHVPADYNAAQGWDPTLPQLGSNPQPSGILNPGYMRGGTLYAGLTTPVSYVSNCWLQDPFVGKTESLTSINFDEQVYSYNVFVKVSGRDYPGPSHQYYQFKYKDFYGSFRLGSIGPDRDWYNNGTFASRRHTIVYDPTNGTVSVGNIWRSEAQPEVKDRPLADR